MTLRDLLAPHGDAGSAGEILVRGLALDSRQVRPGDAFVALAGTQAHGLAFAAGAAARGAVVVLAEKPGEGIRDWGFGESGGVPVVWVEDLREQLGAIAARFYGEPSQALHVVGVTGTNGKTSTVQLLAQALEHAGRRAATIGTLGAGLYGALREGERTTPDAIAVQALLADFRDAGASHVAMEVSSHALEQGRVNAVAFELAVFTNLTRDHLDYHGTMDAYGAAKQRLFAWPGLRAAIVNVDDAFGRTLAATLHRHPGQGMAGTQTQGGKESQGMAGNQTQGGKELIRYGIERADADVVASAIESTAAGLAFHLRTPWGEGRVATHLLGRFNVSNLLAVAACLGRLGLAFDAIRAALEALQPVAGRMSRLGGSATQPLVVVDYAHTPDALEQALTSLRAHCAGQLVCVFGCGGERDAGKRPQMGAIAEALADRLIVTDDNPRGEDGDAIVAQIVAGLARPQAATVERDRAGAISLAIAAGRPGDIVLIAGKGHEPYQEVAGVKQPFDDLAVARRVLELRAC
jgi:UDP-N-acetylmuramoyl-L-alanyl-D-glutamate--2,6-diaminopimelate ligase